MLLEIKDGSVTRGGRPVLTHFDFYIKGTENAAIVGKNGAGKTTLLEVLAGIRDVDRDDKSKGHGVVTARNVTIGYLTQKTELPVCETLDHYLQDIVNSTSAEESERQAEVKISSLLTGFGIPLSDKVRDLAAFSGGERKKIQLLGLLLAEPDILLLDEPTNHLDLNTVDWLEGYLRNYKGAVVLVSHDRYFIDHVVDDVWEITGGKLKRYTGGYTAYRTERSRHAASQLKAYEAQQEEIRHQRELIEKFKHKPRKAAFARSRVKMLERMERIEKPEADDAVIHTQEISPAHLGSKWVYSSKDMEIGYEKERPIQNINCRIRRGSKIAVIGENGSGKSTFLKTVIGELAPIRGKAQMGNGIEIGYFDQKAGEIQSDQIVIDYFHDQFPALKMEDVRRTLAGYLFHADDMGKRVSALSGGEKARLVLAGILEAAPNFLVLDEPTNNMDIPAKETIESILKMYKGTILLVSHDRYLISEVCSSLLIFSKNQEEVRYYPFGYRHYREHLGQLASGQDPAAIRSAEDQRLIEGLRAVPEKEHHRLKEYSTEERNRDWRYALNREMRENAEQAVLELESEMPAYMSLEEYMHSPAQDEEEKREKAAEQWTSELLDWYDIYLETHTDEE